MKFYIIIISTLIFLTSCGSQPSADNTVNENVKEKNKITAAKNEVTKITRLAQTIEQQGRDMQLFRESRSAESKRQCDVVLEEQHKQIQDLEIRVKALPENYQVKLLPITSELNECISCVADKLENCKKARALTNEAISGLFP